jgi:hypothetical protein
MKYILLASILFVSISGIAQDSKAQRTETLILDSNFFNNEKPFHIILKSDFKKLSKEKRQKKFQNAELIYFIQDSIEVLNQIQIKARGHNRNSECSFPPLQIAFGNKPENDQINPLHKYKLVVHCNDTKACEVSIFKEYLCYKLYSCISDKSFKVRLINAKYINTYTKSNNETNRFAILIENEENLENRLNITYEKNLKLSQVSVNQENIMNFAMFQFMIGNFDWGVPTQRNLKLVRPNLNPNEIYAIPYDFDYSGLVNASYAFPSEEMGIKSVKERIYLGQCKPKEDFLSVISKFKDLKSTFYKQIENFEYLDKNQKKEMFEYLDQFYEILDFKNFYSNYILKNCKKLK